MVVRWMALAAAMVSIGVSDAHAQTARPGRPVQAAPQITGDLSNITIAPLSEVQRRTALQRILGSTSVAAVGTPVTLTVQHPWDQASGAALGYSGDVWVRMHQNTVQFQTGGPAGGLIRLRLPAWANGQVVIDCSVVGVHLTEVAWDVQPGGAPSGTAPVVDQHAVFIATVPSAADSVFIRATYDDRWILQGCEIRRLQ